MKNLAAVVALAGLAHLMPVTGMAAASVVVTPSVANPPVGSSYSVLVRGFGFPTTAGATLGLTWNHAAVSVMSITLAPGSPFTGGVVASAPWYPFSVLAPLTGTLPSGNFDAFEINFLVVGTGSPNIRLVDDQFDFCWTNSVTFGCVTPITYTQADGTVEVLPPTTGDTTPDPFQFVDQTDVPLSTLVASAPVTITGINAPAPVSIGAGSAPGSTWSPGCTASFTSFAGLVSVGQTVCVRHLSSASFGTATSTVLNVGGVTDTFTTTTATVPDTTPDPYQLVDQTDVPVSTLVVSAPLTVTGINTPTPISIGAGSAPGSDYSLGCSGSFTSVAALLSVGQTVCVRHTSSASFSTATSTVLDIGGVTDTFTTTTESVDTTPDTFTLVDQAGVELSTLVTSAPVTIHGITVPAPISVSGDGSPEYSIDGSAYTSLAGTVTNGAAVRVRHTSSASPNTPLDSVLNIGGIADTFTSTTVEYAIDDSAVTGINQQATIDALQNDVRFADPVTAGVWVAAGHGSMTVSGSPGPKSGIRFEYTPAQDYVGGDSFEYWVQSGSVIDYATVSLFVDGDDDGDGRFNTLDNCPVTPNPGQENSDGDSRGNACDNCTLVSNVSQADIDGDGYGDSCDWDFNNSGAVTATDYTILRSCLSQLASSSALCAAADLNRSGLVTSTDFTLFKPHLNSRPGPSGLRP